MATGAQQPTVSISAPTHSHDAHVYCSGPGSFCSLCQAAGTWNDDGLDLETIWLRLYANHVTPTEENVDEVLQGEPAYETGTNQWEYRELQAGPNVDISTTGTLMVLGEFWSEVLGRIVVTDIASAQFNSINTNQPCPQTAKSHGSHLSAIRQPKDVHPFTTGDGWLHFDLHVDHRWGNRLLAPNGQPLRASMIAMAAPIVRWRPRPEIFVHRPFGLTTTRSHFYFSSGQARLDRSWVFRNAPTYGIGVAQRAYALNALHVVHSTESGEPDYLSTDNTADIFVNVNNRRRTLYYQRHAGAIQLSVRVIS